YTLPVLLALPKHITDVPAQMDLDDVESVTRDRIAAIARANGDTRLAEVMRRDADEYRRIEGRDLARFRRVFVCSDDDRTCVSRGRRAPHVDVIPNVVT